MKTNRAPRRVLFSILCVIFGLASGLGTGLGQAQTFGADVGTIYLSGSPTSYVDNIVVEPLTPFDFYIVAEIDYADIGAEEQNATNGISAWAAAPRIPSGIIITQVELNPRNALELGGWVIGLGVTFTASTSPLRLATLTGFIVVPVVTEDLMLEIHGVDPPIFFPPGPGFLDGEIMGECSLPDQTPTKCKRTFAVAKAP